MRSIYDVWRIKRESILREAKLAEEVTIDDDLRDAALFLSSLGEVEKLSENVEINKRFCREHGVSRLDVDVAFAYYEGRRRGRREAGARLSQSDGVGVIMSEDTDRRARAIELVESLGHAVWKRDDPIRNDVSEFRRGGFGMEAARLAAFYLAGAREEAEIKDTQIAALESRLADQAKEVSSLRDTALAYGDHTGCRLRSPMGSYAGEDEKYCDCGWTTVRRAIGAKEQAEPGGAR